jgi:hypothetical protein
MGSVDGGHVRRPVHNTPHGHSCTGLECPAAFTHVWVYRRSRASGSNIAGHNPASTPGLVMVQGHDRPDLNPPRHVTRMPGSSRSRR